MGLADKAEPLVESIVTTIVGFLPYLIYLILVPILAFFLLKDASKIEHGLVSFMPTERLQKRIRWLLLDVSRTLAAYIRAQITACIEIGALVSVGLIVLGVPYALVLGLVSGALEFFPMVGPLMAGATIFVMTLITAPTKAFAVVLFLIVMRIVQDYIIYPKIVGHGIEMHPLVIILAVFGGHEVYGLMGVFLSIPFVAMVMVAYSHYVAYRGIQGIQPGAEAAALEKAESPADTALQAPPGTAPALEK
jgi:predicted PurR-regulated permease PerM